MRVPRLLRKAGIEVSGSVLSGGKLQGRAAVASVSAGSLTLHDAKTNQAFLIDTGAEVSVVPASEQEWQGAPWTKELVAANGSRIRCYGEKKLRLHVGPRVYEWTFLVAEVRRPLIGADFLMSSSLLVDLRNRRLVHPEEMHSTPLQPTRRKTQVTGLAFATTAKQSTLDKLFAEFPAVVTPNFKMERQHDS